MSTSSEDLKEALMRAGAAAVDAGLSFEKLIQLVLVAQDVTVRGGTVIGNSLKTALVRLGNRRDELKRVGVRVYDSEGQALSADEVFKSLSAAYDHMNEDWQNRVTEILGGTYQVNILKAVLSAGQTG